jgi:tetratricopeptide (TPR) repeat protein
LFEDSFATAVRANPIFCHQEFLEKLETHRNHPIGKRASLLMQRLAVDGSREYYKGTQGVNRGWRRSRLGGNQGSHFYAWWAPQAAPPIKSGDGFKDAPSGAIFLRDIRHHDDHSSAAAQSFNEHYLPVSVQEMRREDYAPAPWTPVQARFASARQPVRILKGHPGSGKTTALLHAADSSGAGNVLYVTYSRDLAVLAQQYFDRFCSRQRRFHVVTYENFLRQLLRVSAAPAAPAELKRRFRGDLVPFARMLGPWTDRVPALYDELHAHVAGAALPAAVGRFAASTQPHVSEKNYRERRVRYVGDSGARAALDVASRLERNQNGSLAERYFPELALAWQAASALTSHAPGTLAPEFFEFDCIAVDECQDLTPLEAFVLVELAASIGRRKRPIPVFWAGDEAQTVRPTDFEWGWMNDLLHHRLGTPVEFKLTSNLRSPRGLAMLVNRVWDLYAEVGKRDRPSGSGYAEIDDDATDQVLFCAAAPGPELESLMNGLAAREGLAIVALEETARDLLPQAVRSAVLTPAEVKGLDFHTVCLLNAGKHLESITSSEVRYSEMDMESIRRRLAIDELRVALSRPSGRLLWLDLNPTPKQVRATLDFLNRDAPQCPVAACVPGALLTALEEEELSVEERIQRCQADARQFLSVRPGLAWSRAQQAVTLLGQPDNPAAVQDESVRRAAFQTLTQIAFTLAFRGAALPPELGAPNLFLEASQACRAGGNRELAMVILDIGGAVGASVQDRLPRLGTLAQTMYLQRDYLDPWLLAEIGGKAIAWVEELEDALHVKDNPITLSHILPPFYDALRLPDAEARKQKLFDRAVRFLVKNKRYGPALEILGKLSSRRPELEAECYEAIGDHPRAAEIYMGLGKLKEALSCYRAIPDFEAAMGLLAKMDAHPAQEAYQWLGQLRTVLAKRPQNFNKVMQPSEKKMMEHLLEQALGVARKPPAPRKTAVKKKKPPF